MVMETRDCWEMTRGVDEVCVGFGFLGGLARRLERKERGVYKNTVGEAVNKERDALCQVLKLRYHHRRASEFNLHQGSMVDSCGLCDSQAAWLVASSHKQPLTFRCFNQRETFKFILLYSFTRH